MELTYYQQGDCPFPNLTIGETRAVTGKYEMLRKTYLKENRSDWYQSMLLSGKLDNHLAEVEKVASERMEIIMAGLLKNIRHRIKKRTNWHGQRIWTG